LGRCGEEDLLVHFPRTAVAGAGQAVGQLGFAEEVLDTVPEFSGKLVAAGGRAVPDGLESVGAPQLLAPFSGPLR
jgi:hypothetical protein